LDLRGIKVQEAGEKCIMRSFYHFWHTIKKYGYDDQIKDER
jgi:hypothetical protein